MTSLAQKPRAKRRPRHIATRLLLIVPALLLLAYLGISTAAAYILSTPRRVGGDVQPATYGFAAEDVTFPSRGGDLQLRGWLLPQDGATDVIVIVHGKDNSGGGLLRDGYGTLFRALGEQGFAVLLLDMRGHGRSDDGRYSFGLNERRDVWGAVDWLRERGFAAGDIGVYGLSMGAASSIMASAEEMAVGALVADCSFSAILPIIEREWTATSGLPQFFLPTTLLLGRLLFGYDIAASRPIDVIDQLGTRPVLLIHGTGDMLIAPSEADALQAAYPAAELWKVQGAPHSASFQTAQREYSQRVASFFAQSLQ
ncbi:MAG: alpha/beta fold hydrolase [Roseiflexaceae bacterium]|nr:alpha/beta fold hydrolase [Roseiflexaceae bacterium]